MMKFIKKTGKVDLDMVALIISLVFAAGLTFVSLFYCMFGLALVGAFGMVVSILGIRYFSFENDNENSK